jgi:phage FluMu gp28-like protein
MRLLTDALISDAESSLIQSMNRSGAWCHWQRMHRAKGDLYVGNDIGRNRDLSVVTVLEKWGR